MDAPTDMLKPPQGEAVQKVLQELSLRIAEITPIYKPLVLRMKKMVREGVDDEGEILLDGVKQFLAHELSAEALTTFWKTFDTKASQAAETPKYNALAKRLQHGELIPFLGPEIHYLAAAPLMTGRELAQKLAEQAEYRDFSGPLAMISQYYQMTEYGRSMLLRTVQEAFAAQDVATQPNPLYALLADIPQPLIVISASYDNQFERVLIARQKKFVVISHVQEESAVGKILLKYGEKPEPEEPGLAEELSKLRLLENGYTILYKVCGCLGLFHERIVGKTDQDRRLFQQKDAWQKQWDLLSEKLSRLQQDRIIATDTEEKFKLDKRIAEISAEREQLEQQLHAVESKLLPNDNESEQFISSQSQMIDSVLISEDDYFAFAKHVEKVIPDYLTRQFARRSFLLLGHNLSEWYDRLILNAILEKKRTQTERSYAVQEHPTAYATAYWKAHSVDLYQVNLKTFVEKLGEHLK